MPETGSIALRAGQNGQKFSAQVRFPECQALVRLAGVTKLIDATSLSHRVLPAAHSRSMKRQSKFVSQARWPVESFRAAR